MAQLQSYTFRLLVDLRKKPRRLAIVKANLRDCMMVQFRHWKQQTFVDCSYKTVLLTISRTGHSSVGVGSMHAFVGALRAQQGMLWTFRQALQIFRTVLLQLPQRVIEEFLETLEGEVFRDVASSSNRRSAGFVIRIDSSLHQNRFVVLPCPDLKPLQL